MQVINKINLDLGKKSNPPIVYAMQNDVNSRVIEISLFSDSVLWNVPPGASASVAFKNTSDGHKGWYDTIPDGSPACSTYDNVVRVILAPAVVSSPGEVSTVIVFQDVNLNQLATFNFSVIVEKNPAADISISNDYYAYSTMEDISKAVDAMLNSLQTAACPAIVCEASGRTISISDASNRTLQGLTLYGKTTQDGIPTPESPVELVNIGIKNYLPKTEYTLDGSRIYLTLPAGNYTLSFDAPQYTPPTTIAFYDAAGATLFSKNISPSLKTTIAINLSSEATSMVIAPKDPYTITNATLTKGSICVTVAGNNLFNKENAETVGGYVDPNGNVAGNASVGTTWFVPVSEDIKYTISTSGPSGFYHRAIRFLDSAKSLIGFDGKDTNAYGTVFTGGQSANYFTTATFTTPKGCKYVQVGSLNQNFGSDSTIMLNYGDTALPYEPYKEIQTLTVSTTNGLPGIPVTSGGNYTDENGQAWICDEIDFARGVYVQRVGRIDEYASESVTEPYLSTTGELSVGATVLYVLTELVETALSAKELEAYALLHTNKPNTTVLNDSGAGMAVGYVADTKTYIDNVTPDENGNVVPELVPTAETAFSAGVIIPDSGKFISYAAAGITGGADYEDGKIILHIDAAEEGSTNHVAGSIDVTDIIKNVKSIEISVSGKVTDLYLSKNDHNWGIHAIKKLDPGFNDISTIDFTGIDKIYFLTAIYGYEPPSTGEVSFTIRPKGIVYADKFVGQEQYPTFADIDMPRKFITCWGDSLTAQGGWTNIIADLSGITVNNAGTGGENSSCIMARQGADVMLVNNITIPADATPVQVATYNEPFTTAFGKTVRPLLQGGGGHVNPVTIAGVEGALKFTGSTYNDSTGVYTFTRTAAGDAVSVNRPTAVVTKADKEWNSPHLMIIFMGQNDGNFDVDELVNKHRLMIDHAHAKNVVVLGLSSGSASYRETYETAMRKAFGRHFISLREYLSEYGLADADITPTSADTTAMDKGEVPPKLLKDTVHYTDACKTVIGNMLYKKCCELGIFNY